MILIAGCTGRPEVTVEGETLRGERLAGTEIAVFRGVPFAEPPVGDLRWRAPEPYVAKTASRDAAEFAPACMQSMGILEWYRDMAEIFGSTRDEFADLHTSEDCLYLNIWTPSLGAEAPVPVMVYIHGGSNDSGWAYEPDYRGHVLAERGVVLVSIAYRLGAFGFLSHPETEGDAVANFGLWDQLAALKWLREHIAKFGGDPERITLFGESAGAQDVLALMASEQARGLFHGAILQSNAGFGLGSRGAPTLASERQRGVETAALFGFEEPDAWQMLKKVPAAELLQRYEEAFPDYYHSPAVDGQLLKETIWQTIEAGELADIPFIIGSNGNEWYDSVPANAGPDDLQVAIEQSEFLAAGEAHEVFRGGTDYRSAMDRLRAANGMVCPSQHLAARYDGAWVYYFTRIRDGEGGARVRAYHGAELPYTFGTHPDWMTTTDVDRALTDDILSYWTRFAATGNPNGYGTPEWPEFGGPDSKVMVFGDEAQPGDAPEPELCRIFQASVAPLHAQAEPQ